MKNSSSATQALGDSVAPGGSPRTGHPMDRLEELTPDRWPEWDGFLRGMPESRVRQSSLYAAALALHGWTPRIVTLRSNGRIVAGALLGEKQVPVIGRRLRMSGGAAVDHAAPVEWIRHFFAELDRFAKGRGAIHLHFDWRRPLTVGGVPALGGQTLRTELESWGLARFHEPGTYHIPLAGQSQEELFARLDPQARQNIRRAGRDGVKVEVETSEEALRDFEAGFRDMSGRKQLGMWPQGFRERFLRPAIDRGLGTLLVAKQGETRLNCIFVGHVGAPLYEWGAIAPRPDGKSVPPTGELLHYDALCRFREHPHGYYDLGGSPGPEPIEGHPNYTVWRFKKKLGGTYVAHVGAGDRVYRQWADSALARLGRLG